MVTANPIILIPARLGSTRLPKKALLPIMGKPMIAHVVERALESGIAPVVVATDTAEIAVAAEAAGAKAVMTRADHASGSDRITEALQAIDPQGNYDLVINLQGDLPTLEPKLVQQVLQPFTQAEVQISTLVAEIRDAEEKANPNVVKAVVAWQNGTMGKALYFTRATAPYGDGALYHHIGIYAYRRDALLRFMQLPPSPLELREKLEQLRALEAGMHIAVVKVDTVPLGVDTAEDLAKAEKLLS